MKTITVILADTHFVLSCVEVRSVKPLPVVRFSFKGKEHDCQVGGDGYVFLDSALRRAMGMIGVSGEGARAY